MLQVESLDEKSDNLSPDHSIPAKPNRKIFSLPKKHATRGSQSKITNLSLATKLILTGCLLLAIIGTVYTISNMILDKQASVHAFSDTDSLIKKTLCLEEYNRQKDLPRELDQLQDRIDSLTAILSTCTDEALTLRITADIAMLRGELTSAIMEIMADLERKSTSEIALGHFQRAADIYLEYGGPLQSHTKDARTRRASDIIEASRHAISSGTNSTSDAESPSVDSNQNTSEQTNAYLNHQFRERLGTASAMFLNGRFEESIELIAAMEIQFSSLLEGESGKSIASDLRTLKDLLGTCNESQRLLRESLSLQVGKRFDIQLRNSRARGEIVSINDNTIYYRVPSTDNDRITSPVPGERNLKRQVSLRAGEVEPFLKVTHGVLDRGRIAYNPAVQRDYFRINWQIGFRSLVRFSDSFEVEVKRHHVNRLLRGNERDWNEIITVSACGIVFEEQTAKMPRTEYFRVQRRGSQLTIRTGIGVGGASVYKTIDIPKSHENVPSEVSFVFSHRSYSPTAKVGNRDAYEWWISGVYFTGNIVEDGPGVDSRGSAKSQMPKVLSFDIDELHTDEVMGRIAKSNASLTGLLRVYWLCQNNEYEAAVDVLSKYNSCFRDPLIATIDQLKTGEAISGGRHDKINDPGLSKAESLLADIMTNIDKERDRRLLVSIVNEVAMQRYDGDVLYSYESGVASSLRKFPESKEMYSNRSYGFGLNIGWPKELPPCPVSGRILTTPIFHKNRLLVEVKGAVYVWGCLTLTKSEYDTAKDYYDRKGWTIVGDSGGPMPGWGSASHWLAIAKILVNESEKFPPDQTGHTPALVFSAITPNGKLQVAERR